MAGTATSAAAFFGRTSDLSSFDGKAAVYIRFRLITNSSVTQDGVYLDDIRVRCLGGGSMATDRVPPGDLDGHAARRGCRRARVVQDAGATPADIKSRLLSNVDPKPSLAGKTVTGGRLNVGALFTQPPSLTDSIPSSPANDNSPLIKGRAGRSDRQAVHGADCTGTVAAEGTAAAFASPGLQVSVGTTPDHLPGNHHRRTVRPRIARPPRSPTSRTRPRRRAAVDRRRPRFAGERQFARDQGHGRGRLDGEAVHDAGCTSAPTTTGTAATFASPGLTVSVGERLVDDLQGDRHRRGRQTSACSPPRSPTSRTRPRPPRRRSTAPTPTRRRTTTRPRSTARPRRARRSSSTRTPRCTGAVAASGTAAAFASPGTHGLGRGRLARRPSTPPPPTRPATSPAARPPRSPTSRTRRRPAAPTLTATDPGSPRTTTARDQGHRRGGLHGQALHDARLHRRARRHRLRCGLRAAGLTVAVADDSSTTFQATATDAAGNVSGCSRCSVTYVEDSTRARPRRRSPTPTPTRPRTTTRPRSRARPRPARRSSSTRTPTAPARPRRPARRRRSPRPGSPSRSPTTARPPSAPPRPTPPATSRPARAAGHLRRGLDPANRYRRRWYFGPSGQLPGDLQP